MSRLNPVFGWAIQSACIATLAFPLASAAQVFGPAQEPSGPQFDRSVAELGDLMLVGESSDCPVRTRYVNCGAAYLFRHNGTRWVEEAALSKVDPHSGDQFGAAVAIAGDFAVVGAPGDDNGTLRNSCNFGAVYVYADEGSGWIEHSVLVPQNAQIGDRFGTVIAASGYYLAVASTRDSLYGPVYIFHFVDGEWINEATLHPNDFDINLSTSILSAMARYPDADDMAYTVTHAVLAQYLQETISARMNAVAGDNDDDDDLDPSGMDEDDDELNDDDDDDEEDEEDEELLVETLNIQTTGAIYAFDTSTLFMISRIDPATNTVNEREVARLEFDDPLIDLEVISESPDKTVLRSDRLEFTVRSDSLLEVKNISSSNVSYEHVNLISNAQWNRGSGANRMWTSGRSGSLHASKSKTIAYASNIVGGNSTLLTIAPSQEMAHMVFPARFFDFDAYYGSNARPVHYYMDGTFGEEYLFNHAQRLRDAKVGVCVIWSNRYLGEGEGSPWSNEPESLPQVLESGPFAGYLGHDYREPEATKQLIDDLHAEGFQVISYIRGVGWQANPMSKTLEWMQWLQDEYDLDGWYFDNAMNSSSHPQWDAYSSWYKTYEFVKTVRSQVGEGGHLFHHNSKDAWGLLSQSDSLTQGLRAVMIDTHMNAMMSGEVGYMADLVDDPKNIYLRYYSSGYGLSQAFGEHKRHSNQTAAVSHRELDRLMGQNLRGLPRRVSGPVSLDFLETYWMPAHQIAAAEYQQGTLLADVNWPVTDWFRSPTNVQVNVSGTTATITWNTDQLSDSHVAWSMEGSSNEMTNSYDSFAWWNESTLDDLLNEVVGDDFTEPTTSHQVTLSNLEPGTNYEFRIRSNNGGQELNEVIWGYIGSFSTSP